MNKKSNSQIIGIEDGKKKNNTQYTCKEVESSNEQLQKMDSKKKELKQKSSKRWSQEEEKSKKKEIGLPENIGVGQRCFHAKNKGTGLSPKSQMSRVQAYLQSAGLFSMPEASRCSKCDKCCVRCCARCLENNQLRTTRKMLKLLHRMTGQEVSFTASFKPSRCAHSKRKRKREIILTRKEKKKKIA